MESEKVTEAAVCTTSEANKEDTPVFQNFLPSTAVAQLELDILKTRLQLVAQAWAPSIYKRGTRETDTLQLGKRNRGMLGILGFGGTGNTPRHSSHSALSGKMTSSRPRSELQGGGAAAGSERGGSRGSIPKLSRAVKSKSNGSGRTYTSKYRGVHQTFPTKRWEAQFRRNGKPTSLGCFDHEDEAARAYDKMMLWCELHNAAGMKSGITNFEASEYERDVAWLSSVTQDELIEAFRSDGRRQAAHRMLRQKREGQDELIESLRSDGRRQAAHRMLRQKREGQVGQTDDEGPSSSAPLDN
eukprot:gene10237-8154_t